MSGSGVPAVGILATVLVIGGLSLLLTRLSQRPWGKAVGGVATMIGTVLFLCISIPGAPFNATPTYTPALRTSLMAMARDAVPTGDHIIKSGYNSITGTAYVLVTDPDGTDGKACVTATAGDSSSTWWKDPRHCQ